MIDHNLNLKECSSVITAVEKITFKEIVNLGRTYKRRTRGTKDPRKMKIPQSPTFNGEVLLLFVEEEECHVAVSFVEWIIYSTSSNDVTSNKTILYDVQSRRLWKSNDGK